MHNIYNIHTYAIYSYMHTHACYTKYHWLYYISLDNNIRVFKLIKLIQSQLIHDIFSF